MKQSFDVAIVGAGVIGLQLAHSLRTALPEHYKIAIISSTDLMKAKTFNRYVSLTKTSLSHLSLPDDIGFNYDKINVWDVASKSRLTFDKVGASIVNATQLESKLFSRLASHTKTTELFNESMVESITLSDTKWPELSLGKGDVLRSRLLVGADGANSKVRTACNIQSMGFNYDKRGVVCSFKTSGLESAAWQRFLLNGPIALLPTSEDSCTIVWTLLNEHAAKVSAMPSDSFLALVNAALVCDWPDIQFLLENTSLDPTEFKRECEWSESRAKNRIDSPRLIETLDEASTRASFPLAMRNSRQYSTDRVCLVGDAAHSIHPLAGQGMNMGIKDVECLSRVLSKAASCGQDLGLVGNEYANERYIRNLGMIGAVFAIDSVYGARSLDTLRGFGMGVLDRAPFLKSALQHFVE